MKTAIFDLDGTLADTSHDLLAAANAVFEEDGLGAPLTHAAHAGTALRGGRAMLRKGAEMLELGWTDAEIDPRYPRLLTAYAKGVCVRTELYPGCLAAIERLLGAGWAVGICTNKPEGLAEALMTELGVRDRFGSLIGADTLPTRKPDAAPVLEAIRRAGGSAAEAVLVGDTITDRDASTAAEIASVLVTFGPGEDVRPLAPEGLLHGYEDLEPVLEAALAVYAKKRMHG